MPHARAELGGRGSTDQSELLKLDDHPMDGGRRDSAEGLHVGLGG
jgi:hypothetical protein